MGRDKEGLSKQRVCVSSMTSSLAVATPDKMSYNQCKSLAEEAASRQHA